MQKQLLNGKIHRVTVTDARIDYEGSITIDCVLMKKAGILPFEKVLIANLNNGSRIESYAIPGPARSGVVCLNGGAAKHGKPGDIVIILTFAVFSEKEIKKHKPKIVYVDHKNHIVKKKGKRGQALIDCLSPLNRYEKIQSRHYRLRGHWDRSSQGSY